MAKRRILHREIDAADAANVEITEIKEACDFNYLDVFTIIDFV